MKTSSTLNLIKLVIPIDDLHAVFCQQPVVEPEPDIESSAKVEQQPEHITLSTQKTDRKLHSVNEHDTAIYSPLHKYIIISDNAVNIRV